MQAIRSFPCNSAGGPDGLRPQHLVDMTSASAERGGRELLTTLSSFILHILEGNTPSSIQPILFGANLIALNKKEGGIRPIAVGQILHRLAAKIILAAKRWRIWTVIGSEKTTLMAHGCIIE